MMIKREIEWEVEEDEDIKQEIEWEVEEDEDKSQSLAGSTTMTGSVIRPKPASSSSSCSRSVTSMSRCGPEVKLGEEQKEVTIDQVEFNGLLLRKVCQPALKGTTAAFKQGHKVKCSKCWDNEDSWRKMKNEKVWVDKELYWRYTCVHCYMVETGLSYENAMAHLRYNNNNSISINNRKERMKAFANAKKQVRDKFHKLSEKEIRRITHNSFYRGVFAPWRMIRRSTTGR